MHFIELDMEGRSRTGVHRAAVRCLIAAALVAGCTAPREPVSPAPAVVPRAQPGAGAPAAARNAFHEASICGRASFRWFAEPCSGTQAWLSAAWGIAGTDAANQVVKRPEFTLVARGELSLVGANSIDRSSRGGFISRADHCTPGEGADTDDKADDRHNDHQLDKVKTLLASTVLSCGHHISLKLHQTQHEKRTEMFQKFRCFGCRFANPGCPRACPGGGECARPKITNATSGPDLVR